jgi:hypothetical protein
MRAAVVVTLLFGAAVMANAMAALGGRADPVVPALPAPQTLDGATISPTARRTDDVPTSPSTRAGEVQTVSAHAPIPEVPACYPEMNWAELAAEAGGLESAPRQRACASSPRSSQRYGTSVDFAASPVEAARHALQEGKLVFVLHLSGHFEDPRFTWNNAEALRGSALADSEVGAYLNEHFVSSVQKLGTFRLVGGQKQGGNVASYFCLPDGRVLHIVAGSVDAATLLREARWVIDAVQMARMLDPAPDDSKLKAVFGKAHADRLRQEHGLNFQARGPLAVLGNVAFDHGGRCGQLQPQGRVHLLLTACPLVKLDEVYEVVFEKILGEKVSTLPVIERGTKLPPRRS